MDTHRYHTILTHGFAHGGIFHLGILYKIFKYKNKLILIIFNFDRYEHGRFIFFWIIY